MQIYFNRTPAVFFFQHAMRWDGIWCSIVRLMPHRSRQIGITEVLGELNLPSEWFLIENLSYVSNATKAVGIRINRHIFIQTYLLLKRKFNINWGEDWNEELEIPHNIELCRLFPCKVYVYCSNSVGTTCFLALAQAYPVWCLRLLFLAAITFDVW